MASMLTTTTITKPTEGWAPNSPILSSPVRQKGGSSTGARFHVVFDDVTKAAAPLGNPGFALRAVIEEEVAPGIYVPVAAQHQEINNNEKKNQILVLTPNPVFDQGVPENVTEDTVVSRTQNELPGDYRLSIYYRLTDPTRADLESLTVTAYVQET